MVNKLLTTSMLSLIAAPAVFAGNAGTPANDAADGVVDGVVFLNANLAEIDASVSGSGFDINQDLTLNSGYTYILPEFVFVANNSTITIAAGVVVRGEPKSSGGFDPGTLIITRDGQINAQGTATNPIIFTSSVIDDGFGDPAFSAQTGAGIPYNGVNGTFWDADPHNVVKAPLDSLGIRTDQLWGGLIINGKAPTNINGVTGLGVFEGFIEGLPQDQMTAFGGFNPHDSSGVISYISLRHGGDNLSADNEINGLTCGAVGDGTQIDHVDVYVNFDDGIEWFGGNVNCSYLNVNFCGDDGLDFDTGFVGLIQFAFILLDDDGTGGHAFECDGTDSTKATITGTNPAVTVQKTFPIFYNVTAIGGGNAVGASSADAWNCDTEFGGFIFNSIFSEFAGVAVQVKNDGTQERMNNGTFLFRENTWWNFAWNGAAYDNTPAGLAFAAYDERIWNGTDANQTGNRITNPGFASLDRHTANSMNPVPALGVGTVVNIAAGFGEPYISTFFTPVAYKGAFDTDKTAVLWTTGWTSLNKAGILVDNGNGDNIL